MARTPDTSLLLQLHESLLQDILSRADLQSRCIVSCTCKRLNAVASAHPPSTVDLSSDGVHPKACFRFIERSKGAVTTITTARHQQRTACDAASVRRFNTGVRCTQVVPYTTGPMAMRLASLLPNLNHMCIDEATCCFGGMTDDFATAIAASCPQLSTLEVAFTRYSLPSELFTDAGMMAIVGGCPRLSSLSLTNCGAITNRSLYAVASSCRGLTHLTLGGYHELISDHGTVVLFQACPALVSVCLSGKLRRVTDDSAEALAANAGQHSLQHVKLTRSMGDRALAALAANCTRLRTVDCSKAEGGAVTARGVAGLAAALQRRMGVAAAAAAAGGDRGEQQEGREANSNGPKQQSRPRQLGGEGKSSNSRLGLQGKQEGGSGKGGSGRGGGEVLRVVLPPSVAATEVLRAAVEVEAAPGAGAEAEAGGAGPAEAKAKVAAWRVRLDGGPAESSAAGLNPPPASAAAPAPNSLLLLVPGSPVRGQYCGLLVPTRGQQQQQQQQQGRQGPGAAEGKGLETIVVPL